LYIYTLLVSNYLLTYPLYNKGKIPCAGAHLAPNNFKIKKLKLFLIIIHKELVKDIMRLIHSVLSIIPSVQI